MNQLILVSILKDKNGEIVDKHEFSPAVESPIWRTWFYQSSSLKRTIWEYENGTTLINELKTED